MPGAIQKRWFTNDLSPSWKPQNDQSFNARFHAQLDQLRSAYQLQPTSFGLDVSNFLRPVFTRGYYAFAMLERLEWSIWKTYPAGIQLSFHFTLSLSVLQSVQLDSSYFKEVIKVPLIAEFPHDYPATRPEMSLNRKRWKGRQRLSWDMTEYICTLNNQNDWKDGQNNTMLNAIDSMVDWLAANHFGQGEPEQEEQHVELPTHHWLTGSNSDSRTDGGDNRSR